MPPHTSSPVTASLPAEPRAEQRPLERTLHDVRLVDEYAWLKAENWREVISDPFQLDPAICLEEAKAQFETAWRQWLAWAKLREDT